MELCILCIYQNIENSHNAEEIIDMIRIIITVIIYAIFFTDFLRLSILCMRTKYYHFFFSHVCHHIWDSMIENKLHLSSKQTNLSQTHILDHYREITIGMCVYLFLLL